MSGDMAPLPESRLDGAVRAGDAMRPIRSPRMRPEPSLVKVLATTLHLWLRRRVLRTPDGTRVPLRRLIAAPAAVAIVAAAIAGGVALRHPGGRATADRPRSRPAPSVNPAIALTAANERAAGLWVVSQVGAHTPVACDANMCAYLRSRGMLASQQVELGPGEPVPGPATVVVATPLVRTEVGRALAVGAPEILASFGAGGERVVLRVTSAGGPAGYLAAARRTVQASAGAGQALLAAGRIQASAGARRELLSGRVDRRLLSLLGQLAAAHAVYLVAFGDARRGATWPSPLRSVTLGRFAGMKDLATLISVLRPQLRPYHATVAQLHLAGGVVEVIIQVPAPSPM